MKHRPILLVPPVGLLMLACAWPLHAGAADGTSSARPHSSRGERGRAARPAHPPTARHGAQGANADASSNAVASSEGGVGVGSQGQSLTLDNHSRGAASTAIAPALTGSNDTCMGSTSVGAAGLAFGVSFGSTYTDDNCMMLKNARELWNMGYRGAAIARMCMDERNRQALEATGVTCPAPPAAKERAAASEPPADPTYPSLGTRAGASTGSTALAMAGAESGPGAKPASNADPDDRRVNALRSAISSSARPDRIVR